MSDTDDTSLPPKKTLLQMAGVAQWGYNQVKAKVEPGQCVIIQLVLHPDDSLTYTISRAVEDTAQASPFDESRANAPSTTSRQ